MPPHAKGLEEWVRRTLRADPPRSKSLIMTVFGDSIAPFTRGIWLSELVQLMEPFGANERLVRTSAFRLVAEGWLRPQRHGRRSRYALTESGWNRVEHATRRIYDPPPKLWNGKWTVVMLRRGQQPAAERPPLRRELEWEGFGTLAPGIFVHPCAELASVRELLQQRGLLQAVVVLEASAMDSIAPRSNAVLVTDCWRTEEVGARYQSFVKSFRPVVALLEQRDDTRTAFVVQTLLVHAFRRAVLHDPRLPAPLLTAEWPGHAAYDLCREIYLRTRRPAHAFVIEHMEETGTAGEWGPEFLGRFGGLEA